MLSLIVAIDEKNAIGIDGDMLCYLPNDLRHFKETTSGHTVIMGKRTLFSLPKYPLPNRRNIVLSSQPDTRIEGVEWVRSIEEAQQAVATEEEAFIMGGGTVYKQFMPLADKLYITHIHHAFPAADTYFPEIDLSIWQQIACKRHEADERHAYAYSFCEYVRRES